MPIYEYVCKKCKHHLEIMQKMSDKPLTRCPECRGRLEKVFSQTSFQFKGSGWYVSDYTNRGKAETSDGTAVKETTAESKSDAKAESKAETSGKVAKTESKTDKSDSKDTVKTGVSK
jgi:putative FmdB family regulatory protein